MAPQNFTAVGTRLFFTATNSSASGNELYVSDGISTTIVDDILPGGSSSPPASLTDVAGTLNFTVDNGAGRELWKSDGSAAGTGIVKDIHPTTGSAPADLTAYHRRTPNDAHVGARRQ